MERWLKLEIMASLAVVQGVFGFLRGYNWIQIGVDLFGQGLLLLPALGAVAVMHGLLVSTVALLYFLFAIGALRAPRKKLGVVARYHRSHHQFGSCCGRIGSGSISDRGHCLVGDPGDFAHFLFFTKARSTRRQFTIGLAKKLPWTKVQWPRSEACRRFNLKPSVLGE